MSEEANLFTPLTIRGVTLRNRLGVSPMCQYISTNGIPTSWQLQFLGAMATGGAGIIFTEATGVSPEGRITPVCAGLWSDEHTQAWKPIVKHVKSLGGLLGIQLAHAGRKASTSEYWVNDGASLAEDKNPWETVGPSAIPFGDNLIHTPKELTVEEIQKVVNDFAAAAVRAVEAGFEVIELHYAHGYLVHSFYSPLSNKRTDKYGGSFENRTRLPLEIVAAIRKVIPETMPLFVRLSATDWHPEGWTADDSVALSKIFKENGVDLVDCSSGFVIPNYKDIPFGAGYNLPVSEKVKKESQIITGVVGSIRSGKQADEIIRLKKADVVFAARQFLRDPYFAFHAAQELEIANAETLLLPINVSHWLKKSS